MMDLEELRTVLDDDQLAAVTAPLGNVLCIANAGSGKTRVLTYRVAYMLASGEPESSIIMLTFTRKAAGEMQERIEKLLGREKLNIRAGTFHSVFLRYIRENYALAGYKSDALTVLDSTQSEDMMAAVLKESAESEFRIDAQTLCGCRSWCLNTQNSISEYMKTHSKVYDSKDQRVIEAVQRILEAYESKKQSCNALDFDDILDVFNHMLDNPAFAARIHAESPNIFVDEYQDVNQLQFEIIQKLVKGTNRLTVVGDDAQSIYAFRGSDVSFIRTFEQSFPNVQTYMIRRNYRSSEQIVNCGLQVINKSPDYAARPKVMLPTRGPGTDIVYHTLNSVPEQTAYITGKIQELHTGGVSYDDIAILFRENREFAEMENALANAGVPYALHGDNLPSKPHVEFILEYLRLLQNPRNEGSFQKLFHTVPGLGEKSVSRLFDSFTKSGFNFYKLCFEIPPRKCALSFRELCYTFYSGHQKLTHNDTVSDLISLFWSQYFLPRCCSSDVPKSISDDIERLREYGCRYTSLTEYLDEITTVMAEEDAAIKAVTITTVHKSKGCEWKCVFLPSATDGLMPLQLNEEERRLMYVAVTRAEDHLDISCVTDVALRGPSRYLLDMWKEEAVSS